MVSKYLKYSVLFSACIILGIGVLLWHPFSKGYYYPLAVSYDKYDYPLITTELQNSSCTLAVRVGSRFPLFLRQETLDAVNKSTGETQVLYNIDGQPHELSSYIIPKLRIGDLILENLLAYQSDGEDHGVLGKFLGGEFNLLLDFPHSRIVACDTFKKLLAKELVSKDWVRVPFEIQRAGIVFHADTDFGSRRLAINTTSTFSHLSTFVFPSETSYVSSTFSLGGQQLGNISFDSIDLPETLLNEIDGFIGMDFLKEHAMYLDYTHKVAYVAPSNRYFERLPITFTKCFDPMIDVCLEDKICSLKFDLGSSFLFSLRREILGNIRKARYGSSKWRDFTGHEYESSAYIIPEISIGNLKFTQALANQDSEDFHANVTLTGPPLEGHGIIGLPILKKYNLFLDFPHSAIYASKDHLLLQEAGLLSQNLLSIPFVFHPDGIFLSVQTDQGTYDLVLDTGATRTAIRAPHSAFTEKFYIAGHDFGRRSVMALEVNPTFDFDGYLGMDFLCEHLLFVDYSNKMIYIDLQKEDQDKLNVLIKHGKDGRPGQNGENGQQSGNGGNGGNSDWGRGGDGGNGGDVD